jgi:hypothetical protein
MCFIPFVIRIVLRISCNCSSSTTRITANAFLPRNIEFMRFLFPISSEIVIVLLSLKTLEIHFAAVFFDDPPCHGEAEAEAALLVEKNGSKSLDRFSFGTPMPVS